MIQRITAVLLSVCLLIPAIAPAGTTLRGKVMLVGTQHELTPAEGVMVTLEETGDSKRTKAGGLFNLPLSDAFGAGERITLQVDKEGWRIQYPLDGELRVPEPTEHQRIAIRLLPLGSKKWWSDDRIEKFIADTAARAKEQVAGETERQVPDFGRYIKEWAIQYGFSAEEARTEIERWVSEVQQKEDDFYKLGLAAFAEKNFGKAERLFRESAAVNAQRMRESERRIEAEKRRVEDYREATIRDYRLAGDAAYNDYAFTNALDAYRAALDLTDRDRRPRQWAEVTMDVAKANYEIGIRTEGPAVGQRLAEAVAAYRAALEVRTFESLPPQWAQTQTNLFEAFEAQDDAAGMASVVEALLRAKPDSEELYNTAQSLYHERLFDFAAAHRLTSAWLQRHRADLGARCNFAETDFTTGRFDEAELQLAALIEGGRLPTETEAALRLLEIANLLALGKSEAAQAKIEALKTLLQAQPKGFAVGWSFAGTAHFITGEPSLSEHREMLLGLIEVAQNGDRQSLVTALDSALDTLNTAD